MKKIKVFSINKDGKIKFTKEQLEKLLNETYDEGYQEALGKQFTWSPPYYTDETTLLNDSVEKNISYTTKTNA